MVKNLFFKNLFSKGGAKIHCPGEPLSIPLVTNYENRQIIAEHIEKHFGSPVSAVSTKVSEYFVLDIYIIAPTSERNFYTLITAGMSDYPMTAPAEVPLGNYFAELILALPSDWPLNEVACKDENNYWPIRGLFTLASFPSLYNAWLWQGETVAVNHKPSPFAQNTKFNSWLIDFPKIVPEDFILLSQEKDKTIIFFAAYPLYGEEMLFRLDHSTDALIELLDENKITELINIDRISVV